MHACLCEGGPSSRALPPSPQAERPVLHRERERSPVGRAEQRAGHDRAAERRRPEDVAPARPRTIRSQVHYDGKVSTAPAPAETEADDKPPRGRHSDARERLDGPDHDAQRNVSPDQRQVSAPRGDRGRDPGSAPGRLAGRITSQVVGFDRLQQREQPDPGHQQRSSGNNINRAGNGVFQRLGGTAPLQHRPAGGMRADARGKWGHDLFETVNAEQEEKPSLLRKSLLF
ncbi:hypothetical protein COCSUDRAFT_41287 [Coccomyxa subellipsoidea C-169]|uniref:Uncharacterized protein n=1 Tax=Coccomyxa subellipsoidea (strain C-169) TaxID=574566 RepID=I0YZX8_COCSC|nr:hypothetical protein COCSUDRAFT_41287 [Coccomyxa subellipsoidea C-169]EIE23947.1 hypothetical protein COCSUDRAFT_41287 [Coccomyxa subellipsoidea C-169]|eukprot:XP_005648491.1 hypothetical protein COCSUDRAFT_41287 [Coccomyxa subellipsoidea C-169]